MASMHSFRFDTSPFFRMLLFANVSSTKNLTFSWEFSFFFTEYCFIANTIFNWKSIDDDDDAVPFVYVILG